MKIFVESPEGKSDYTFKHMAIIGRDPSCDIQIDDPLSSRKHCRIKIDGGKMILEDLGSSNGTKLNNENVKRSTLKESDIIQIGKIKISVTMPPAKPVRMGKPGMVVLVDSNGKKKKFTIKKTKVVLGRDDANDIVLNEKLSSRKHIELTNEAGAIFLEDLGSSNGTRLNGVRLSGKVSVTPDDLIEVGSTKITVTNLLGEVVPVLEAKPSVELQVISPSKTETVRLSGELTFGRDDVCDVVLFESLSSRRHFKIVLKGKSVFVTDLNSSNGTKINGERIEAEHFLKPDDVVSVGETRIQLLADIIKVKTFKVVIEHESQVREYLFKDGIMLGRGEECSIVLRDVKASRKHASITLESGKYYIEDLDSTNGVKVDKIKITKNEIPFGSYAEIGTTKISIIEGPVDPYLGKLFNGYDILKRIGVGDNGTDYIANQRSLKRVVALKFVAPKFFEVEEKKKAFLEDTSNYAKIHDPHIVPVIESFSVNSHGEQLHVLATEFIEGLPLIKRINKNGKIRINNAVQFAIQACQGVEVLHKNNLCHQNLKPSNFLITKAGVVKLADAGMGKPELKSEYELSTEAIWYEAPERGQGQPATFASDIYEMGATLYHAVTGRVPFEGKTALAVNTKKINMLPEEPKAINSDLKPELSDVIMRCLQIKPEDRYATITALAQELEGLHAAPVEWDVGDDYDSFDSINHQDLHSIAWIVVGILCVIGIFVNIVIYNTQSGHFAKEEGLKKIESVLKYGGDSQSSVQDKIKEVMNETTSTEVKEKAKSLLVNFDKQYRSEVSSAILTDYKRALVLLSSGGDNIEEGAGLLKKLVEKTSEDTQVGKKVRSKLFSIQSMLKK